MSIDNILKNSFLWPIIFSAIVHQDFTSFGSKPILKFENCTLNGLNIDRIELIRHPVKGLIVLSLRSKELNFVEDKEKLFGTYEGRGSGTFMDNTMNFRYYDSAYFRVQLVFRSNGVIINLHPKKDVFESLE